MAAVPEVDTQVVMMTPEWADKLLADHDNFRLIKPAKVERIMRDIRAGRWVFDGDPVRLSKTGKLLDGQHRLTAIVMADKAVPVLLLKGLDNKSLEVMDTGTPRSVGDYLRFRGVTDHLNVAAAISVGWKLDEGVFFRGRSARTSPSIGESLTYMDAHPQLKDLVAMAHKAGVKSRARVSVLGGVMMYAMDLGWPLEAVKGFAEAVSQEIPDREDSPAWAFRRYFLNFALSTKRVSMDQEQAGAITIKALEAWLHQKPLTKLAWRRFTETSEPSITPPSPDEQLLWKGAAA